MSAAQSDQLSSCFSATAPGTPDQCPDGVEQQQERLGEEKEKHGGWWRRIMPSGKSVGANSSGAER